MALFYIILMKNTNTYHNNYVFLLNRFNGAVGIEMIDNISQTEHRFDSIASVGKFGRCIRKFFLIIIHNHNST